MQTEKVILTGLPPRFLDDLPVEDQKAIRAAIGKALVLNEYDEDGRAELEFRDKKGDIHFIYVEREWTSKVPVKR
jgi:hypothetical protein